MPNIFEKRVNFKPFEYPETVKFIEAINHSYWLASEWSFDSDVQDFRVLLNDDEKQSIKRAMLAISQIEVTIKTFWMKIGERFPKPEFWAVAACFGDSEQRHESAYSKLLEMLGLNDDFSTIMENPVIKGRVEYMQKYLENSNSVNNRSYITSLALFSLFIENVSLFSQFALIKSFNKHKNVLKDIDNVVSATMMEENIHAMFGIWLINQIKKEMPEWFNEEFYNNIEKACLKAYEAESKIIDWMMEKDLEFISKNDLKEFIKNRFNESLLQIGSKKIFDVNKDIVKNTYWLNEELHAVNGIDFFYKRPTTYTKFDKSVTEDDLF